MKFTIVAAVAAFLPAALAMPNGLTARQNDVTDELLFSISLPSFMARRGDPSTLDWSTDSCSSSPDNPFGFPFDPACQRHDFGYRNYKAQGRFSDANKLRIDNNFKTDLYYQCSGVSAESVCRGLANVYYEAVRAFGRNLPTSEGATTEYQEAVAEYEAEVAKAQAEGLLPAQ